MAGRLERKVSRGPTTLIMLDQNGSDTVGIFVLTHCKCCHVVGPTIGLWLWTNDNVCFFPFPKFDSFGNDLLHL